MNTGLARGGPTTVGDQAAIVRQKCEAFGELAAAVVHTLNNVLQGMVASAENATMLTERAQRSAALEAVVEAGERAGDLNRRLLAFRDGERAHQTLRSTRSRIDDALVLVAWLLPKSIRLEQNIDGLEDVAVHLDWEHVMANLLLIARARVGRGGVVLVEAGLRRLGVEPPCITVSVSSRPSASDPHVSRETRRRSHQYFVPERAVEILQLIAAEHGGGCSENVLPDGTWETLLTLCLEPDEDSPTP